MTEVFGLVLEGLRNNLWGFRCPIYCAQPDLPLLALTLLLGILAGACLTACVFRHVLWPVYCILYLRSLQVLLASPEAGWLCMGSEEEVTQIALQLEGVSISVTARRPRSDIPPARASTSAYPSDPLQPPVSPGAGQVPVEVPPSSASSSSVSPVQRVSPGTSSVPVEVPFAASPATGQGARHRIEAAFPPIPAAWLAQAASLRLRCPDSNVPGLLAAGLGLCCVEKYHLLSTRLLLRSPLAAWRLGTPGTQSCFGT